MSSLFTRIINREIPACIVAEREGYIAFLDIQPLTKGHTLVVPKREIDYLFDLDDEMLAELMLFAKQVALGIQKAVPCLRIGMAVVGLEVPHAHLHLIPLQHGVGDIDFKKERLKPSQPELESLAAYLRRIIP